MDSIGITLTGRTGDAAHLGLDKNTGKPWASFSLAVDDPRGRSGQREYPAIWVKVWTRGPLAEHIADSLVKGDLVTVRADGFAVRTWTPDGPDPAPRAQLEVQAYDVAASMRFETLITAKGERGAAGTGAAPQDGGDPWADQAPAPEVPEVLSGLTR